MERCTSAIRRGGTRPILSETSSDPANSDPNPDPDPKDCGGHGTHVSGIVGANGVVRDVAPNVTFGAYKVFGCSGTTSSDVILQALEQTLADGMQIVNQRLGVGYQWPQAPVAQASTRLVNKGVIMVASAGNNGGNGTYSLGAPGVGSKVIGVASFNNTVQSLPAFRVGSTLYSYTAAADAPPAPLSGSFPMARTGTPTTANDACDPLPADSLSGYITLIRRGTCSFYDKARNAQTAGAVGVVLYNNQLGQFTPSVAGTPPVTIPVVAVTAADGVALNNLIAAGSTTLEWTSETVSLSVPSGNRISSFSSIGLTPDLILKPDIGAPGGFIRSTYPLALGSLSGTSMSSPHVAGAAALLLEARPLTNA
jgi:minor extracellular serine protease Vpr